ncbi:MULTISPECIES: spermidine synthase [unclassified Neptuniibacter]|jgi:spermidine synthase|uniref:spermidine synthase n=1 Tax=unclassified Neptuniibacter TaxID=2630693 RepID=UPI0026E35E5D|nr:MULTISPECIES: methyltransferase [unclassified Neptuniibacter]MDO6513026.1 methyltransferase [Neptuniibacter sp. 2_MG-2023]MDO6592562.1 methyltransferase [Neptuniibacter sp. 1_MG-2023]
MFIPGKEIHRSYDEYGAIRVIDDGNKRYLAFGDTDEQSCWLKSEPLVPQHEYARAMLIALLMTEPKRCITLGLGAGALNSCLHHHYPELKQQIVELRADVIHTAYKYFQLPRSKRLELINMDAYDFLHDEHKRKVDIIFSDIYSEEGLDAKQLSPEYLTAAHSLLKENGWLVLNCWKEHQSSDCLDILRGLFTDIRGCSTSCGNWVVFAGKAENTLTSKQLKQHAKELNLKLGFSLSSSLSRLKQY